MSCASALATKDNRQSIAGCAEGEHIKSGEVSKSIPYTYYTSSLFFLLSYEGKIEGASEAVSDRGAATNLSNITGYDTSRKADASNRGIAWYLKPNYQP